MNRLLLICVILLTGFIASGQSGGVLQDGYQKFKYPNGTVSSEGIFRNGKPDGFWISYYVTGIKKSEGKYSNFQLDSVWVFFDQAGDTTEKITCSEKGTVIHINTKRIPLQESMFSRRSCMPATGRKEWPIPIFRMVKYNRQ